MLDVTKPFLSEGDTLVCLGDSTTAGNNTYVSFLQKKLLQVKIINSGVGGDKTYNAIMRLNSDVFAHNPTAVSIYLGSNDALVGRGWWADEPMIPSESYLNNLIWIVHLCRQKGIEKISIATPLYCVEGEQYNMFGDVFSSYTQAARTAASICKSYCVPLDVMAKELHGEKPWSALVNTRDGIHPLISTQEAIAKSMLKAWNL